MKFISLRELRNRPGSVWKELESDELVLTSNGRPMGILLGVEGSDLQETLASIQRARAIQAVSRMRRRAADAGLDKLSQEEIQAEITAARKVRRRS